ncbi:MAG TPA: ABC transporter ATP-binding protein [Candidatus Limihabitans stercoravium]|nr:ABC transporter ATP-binding protein [Candidatus Limihabitans stercoravium]
MTTSSTIKRLVGELKPVAGRMILICMVTLFSVALNMVGPELLGDATDILYNYGQGIVTPHETFLKLCLKLALVYGLLAIFSTLALVLTTRITSRFFTSSLRIRISEKLGKLPVSFVDSTPRGEILSRMMNDVSNMSNTIHVITSTLISGVLQLLIIIVLLYFINPIMATAVIVLIPLSVVLAYVISRRSEKEWHEFRKINGQVYSVIEEDLSGFDTVKAFNLESRQKQMCGDLMNKYGKSLKRGFWLSSMVQPTIAFTNNIAYVAICVLGGYFAINGVLDVGDVVKVILYAKLFAGPLESIAGGMSSIHRTIACAQRVYKLLDGEEVPPALTDNVPEGDGDVSFEDVNFSYSKDKPLIKNLNINVRSGQKVAIVGPTGGGKTTIVNLLMRFYDVDSGKIVIDGVDISTMDRAKLRQQFSMVLQDTWLFNGTVFENIAYGKEDATMDEVVAAAKKARIHQFICSLPDGYNTVINEESTNISSGQKQLLTIARAYLADRKMLILDEATSNVDTRTEILIQKTMDELMQGRTSFVIAHRLSTIVNADVILVVRDGQIVEQGTHQQLMEKHGFYSEIYNSQYELLK